MVSQGTATLSLFRILKLASTVFIVMATLALLSVSIGDQSLLVIMNYRNTSQLERSDSVVSEISVACEPVKCSCDRKTPPEAPVSSQQTPAITSDDYMSIYEGDPSMQFDNPRLLEFIRRRVLSPSQLPVTPYNRKMTDFSQLGQSAEVDKLLNGKRNGFHIECGAAGGEVLSNSLFFELERDWSGLLIEPDPKFFHDILHRHRHAYTLNACLSPSNQTKALSFMLAGLVGGLKDSMDQAHKKVSDVIRAGHLDQHGRAGCLELRVI